MKNPSERKENIRREIAAIFQDLLTRISTNLSSCLKECRLRRGYHLTHFFLTIFNNIFRLIFIRSKPFVLFLYHIYRKKGKEKKLVQGNNKNSSYYYYNIILQTHER